MAAAKSSNRPRKDPEMDGRSSLVEQLVTRILRPLGLVVLSRERIQETLDDAAQRGRLTRTDANELVAELVRLGRLQTEELLGDLDRLRDRGRQQLDSAARRARRAEPIDRLVARADRARRSVGVGTSFPITSYEELTAAQVQRRLAGLQAAELRKVRDYERRHANRKSVLAAIERSLG